MFVYIDDEQPVFVEQLTLDEARMVVARTESELAVSFIAAHAAYLRMTIAEITDQIAWLESAERAEVSQDAAVEHACGVWADYRLGIAI